MTKEALEEGNKISGDLESLKSLMRDIRPYLGQETYITIRTSKDNYERKYTLTCNSPLYVAIEYALQGMKEELEKKFKALKSDSDIEYHTRPIERTSFWSKVWKR